jgi:hypothetical protein
METQSWGAGPVEEAVGVGVLLDGVVVGVLELGVGVGLAGGEEVELVLVGDGLVVSPPVAGLLVAVGLDVSVVLVEVVEVGDAVAVSASTTPLMGTDDSAWVRTWLASWPARDWLAVTWIEHELTTVCDVPPLSARSTPTIPEENIARPATRPNAEVEGCRMLMDALSPPWSRPGYELS